MMDNLKKLIDVKSLVTLSLTATFIVLALRGIIDGPSFLTIFATIIAFYYGTQTMKSASTAATTNVTKTTVEEGASVSGDTK